MQAPSVKISGIAKSFVGNSYLLAQQIYRRADWAGGLGSGGKLVETLSARPTDLARACPGTPNCKAIDITVAASASIASNWLPSLPPFRNSSRG
jgi:hypothetical protein